MPPREAWDAVHDEILNRAITAFLLENRRQFYTTPGLEGVADHGGDRISKKIQAAAQRLAGKEVVAEELAKLKAGGKGKNGKDTAKAKGKKGGGKKEEKGVKTEDVNSEEDSTSEDKESIKSEGGRKKRQRTE